MTTRNLLLSVGLGSVSVANAYMGLQNLLSSNTETDPVKYFSRGLIYAAISGACGAASIYFAHRRDERRNQERNQSTDYTPRKSE